MENRVVNITAKITPSQKAEFQLYAKKNNLSISEWVCSILEIGKNYYENIGKLDKKIIDLETTIYENDILIKNLITDLENSQKEIKVKNKSIEYIKEKLTTETKKTNTLIESIKIYKEYNHYLRKRIDTSKTNQYNHNQTNFLDSGIII